MEEECDCIMEEVAEQPSEVSNTNENSNVDYKVMKQLDFGDLKISNIKKNVTILIPTEQEMPVETCYDAKLAMVRELSREVHKVVRENHTLKAELKNAAQKALKDQEDLNFILNQRKSKEMDAFTCFSAALQAKNHVLDKFSKELTKTKGELVQLSKTSQIQKMQYKVNLEMMEEKYQSAMALKDEEIRQLQGELRRQSLSSSTSSAPSSPLSQPEQENYFMKKREVLQKQVEDMCRIIDSQSNHQFTFVNQIESKMTWLTEQNTKLQAEVVQLRQELTTKDEELAKKQDEIDTEDDTKKLISKEALMVSIRENIIRLIQDALKGDDDQTEKSLITFLRDMRLVLRQIRRRVLVGCDTCASDDDMKKCETIKNSIIRLGKDCEEI